MTATPTILTSAAPVAGKPKLIAAMSRTQFVEAVAEHVYGQVFCERYTPSMVQIHSAHSDWQRALLAATSADADLAIAYNEGCQRAVDRLRGTTGC
jgi:hypothetical protein